MSPPSTEPAMIRILALLAAVSLAGCVTTPDYTYRSGQDYYYGDRDGYYYDDNDSFPYSGAYLGDYYADLGYDTYDTWWPYWSAYPLGGYPYYSTGFYNYPGWYGSAAYGFPLGSWSNRLWLSWYAPGYWWSASDYWWTYPNYYWVVETPRPDRYRDALFAEKVRHVPVRGSVAGAAIGSSLAADKKHALRREAVRAERVRQVWHRPWPGGGTSDDRSATGRQPVVHRDRDARRQPLSHPVTMPRGEPASRPASVDRVIRRARPQRIDPISVPRDFSGNRHSTPRPTVILRTPSRPTRSAAPPVRHHARSPNVVRSVSRPSRPSSTSSRVSHTSPRGKPRSRADQRDD